jgi:hypothetical protein
VRPRDDPEIERASVLNQREYCRLLQAGHCDPKQPRGMRSRPLVSLCCSDGALPCARRIVDSLHKVTFRSPRGPD